MLKDSELARIKDASVDGAVTLDADYIRGFIARLESAETVVRMLVSAGEDKAFDYGKMSQALDLARAHREQTEG